MNVLLLNRTGKLEVKSIFSQSVTKTTDFEVPSLMLHLSGPFGTLSN